MQIEEKFNRRSADLIEVQQPTVRTRRQDAPQGLSLQFFTARNSDDLRTLTMHMTPMEALELAERIVAGARQALASRPTPPTVAVRTPIVELEGRPIFEGDTLYDRHGERMTAHSYDQPGFPLLMVPIDHDSNHRSTSWATDTHQDGTQVLFWTNPKDA
ncbi:hypothetical protein [Cupriavidus sp. Marseille-Q8015]